MKICKIQSLDLLFLVIFISFYITSTDILELHSTLSEKKIFVTNFAFLTDPLNTQPPPPPPPTHTPPPPPPKSPKCDKGFLSILKTLSWFFKIIML